MLKSLGIVVALLMIVGWLRMPEGNAADVKLYNELNDVITEIRTQRDKNPKALGALKDQLLQTAERITKTLEKTANGDHPARQRCCGV